MSLRILPVLSLNFTVLYDERHSLRKKLVRMNMRTCGHAHTHPDALYMHTDGH